MSMKPSVVEKLERNLRWEAARKNKVALDLLRELVYVEIKPIVLALIEKAKTGDHKTAELLFDRTFGKSKENLDVNVDVKFSLVSLAEQWAEQQKHGSPQRATYTLAEPSPEEENAATVNFEPSDHE